MYYTINKHGKTKLAEWLTRVLKPDYTDIPAWVDEIVGNFDGSPERGDPVNACGYHEERDDD